MGEVNECRSKQNETLGRPGERWDGTAVRREGRQSRVKAPTADDYSTTVEIPLYVLITECSLRGGLLGSHLQDTRAVGRWEDDQRRPHSVNEIQPACCCGACRSFALRECVCVWHLLILLLINTLVEGAEYAVPSPVIMMVITCVVLPTGHCQLERFMYAMPLIDP